MISQSVIDKGKKLGLYFLLNGEEDITKYHNVSDNLFFIENNSKYEAQNVGLNNYGVWIII